MRVFLFPLFLLFILIKANTAICQNLHFDSLWSIGTDYEERSRDITLDSRGNYYIIGSSGAYMNFDIHGGNYTGGNAQFPGHYLARYKSDNSIDWAMHTKYPKNTLAPILSKIDHNENLFVAGYYNANVDIDFSDTGIAMISCPFNNVSFFFALYDSTGSLIKHTELIALDHSLNQLVGDFSFISDVAIDYNNNIYVSGYSGDVFINPNYPDTLKEFSYFLLKMNTDLTVQWIKWLPKEVKEFHNWTNFYPVMIDVDATNDLYVTISFFDSLNVRFQNEPAEYIAATTYYYPNPPSIESSNLDLVIIKYDSDGNYIRHRQLGSNDESRQKHIDAIMLEGHRLVVLASFNRNFVLPQVTYYSTGYDSVYEYNHVLFECDTQLNIIKSQRYHGNMLTPMGNRDRIIGDSCGNILLRSDLFISDSYPFPPYSDNSFPVIDKMNLYLFDKTLSLKDTITISDFHLNYFFSAAMSFGKIQFIGTYMDNFSLYQQNVLERNYSPPNPFYDSFLASFHYTDCEKRNDLPYVLLFPNVFTPNGDSKNDEFKPMKEENVSEISITIFNRWGRQVFNSTPERQWWDGYSEDKNKCSDGVYFYTARYSVNGDYKSTNGVITLLK